MCTQRRVPDALFLRCFRCSRSCAAESRWLLAPSRTALLGDMKWLALQGCCVVPLSFIALTVGPKYISTAKVSLFVLLETVLRPQEAAASSFASALIHVSFFCLDFVRWRVVE
jgi:hypothetical protein